MSRSARSFLRNPRKSFDITHIHWAFYTPLYVPGCQELGRGRFFMPGKEYLQSLLGRGKAVEQRAHPAACPRIFNGENR